LGIERRQQPRFRCTIPCELRIAGQSIAGKVRDVSAGGLSVVADAPPADQGEEVGVTLRVPKLPPIVVRALVWHVRTARRGGDDKALRTFGLVLSDSAPDFAQLVERIRSKQQAAPAAPRPPLAPPTLPLPPRLPLPPPRKALPPPPAPDPSAPDLPALREAPLVASPPPPATREYRIRVKQSSGSRTCRIVASGDTPEAAAEAARNEVGPGWVVLEIAPVV